VCGPADIENIRAGPSQNKLRSAFHAQTAGMNWHIQFFTTRKEVKMNLSQHNLISIAAIVALAGCATAPERPGGAILPLEGGRYQSNIKRANAEAAISTFTRDAEITCKKPETKTRMPWEAAPPPAKYAVISQKMVDKNAKEVKSSDNKMLDAGIAVGLKRFGLEGQDAVEITTIFKCE
jgi:hypothetical protein